MRLAPLFMLPALLLGQTPSIVQDPAKPSLEGQVLNSSTGQPVRKARLTLRMNVAALPATRQQPSTPPPASVTVVSDAAGKFLFPNLEPGDYQLLVRHDNFSQVQLGIRDGSKKADPITLAPADRKTGFLVKMTPYGAIAGRLADEDGDPIQRQYVAVLTYQYTTRGRELVEGSHNATTDDLGEYRIYNVPPGKYFLKVGASARQMPQGQDREEGFVPTFFPGTQDPTNAAPIDLGAGQQLRGINLIMRKARFATVRGRVIAPAGVQPEAGLMVVTENGQNSTSGSTDKEGKFEYTLPPGRILVMGGYTLEARRHRVYLPLQVGYTDINGLELRPIPPMDVTGQVRIEGETTVKVSEVQIGLQAARSTSVTARENGGLIFREMEPFIYRVNPSRLQNLYLKSASWGTADVTDGEIDLTNGVPPRTELIVVLGADAGQIEGTVKNDRSEPADAAIVTLVPVGSRRTRSFYKTANTDALGHFLIRGIAPGSYKVYAWDTVNPNAVMYDPEFLRPYEGAAQNVEVVSNDKKRLELKLTLNKQGQ